MRGDDEDTTSWPLGYDPEPLTNPDVKLASEVVEKLLQQALDRKIRAARFVAEHWRDSYMEAIVAGESQWGIGTHPLALVLSALDGEENPLQLGLPERVHDDFRATLRSKKVKA